MCRGPEHCKEYIDGLDYFEEVNEEMRHYRVEGFKKVVDIAFEIQDLSEHHHEN